MSKLTSKSAREHTSARDFFAKRGIKPRVRKERGYRRYRAGHPEDVPELARNPRYLETYTEVGGWVMPKYPVDLPRRLLGIPPQLRPDKAVVKKHWAHSHADMTPAELAPHLGSKKWREEHDALASPDEEHVHRRAAKYVLAVGVGAKRLDRNPLTDFSRPGRVFFVIEGTPKNDSLVSRGEKSFDVPAVAQWSAPELATFAALHLGGAPVFVVPDSDWTEKSEVIFHATCCREYLRRLGLDAHIASPPPRKRPDKEGSLKNGVDDFLGPGGSPRGRGSPDGLLVIARDVDEAAFLGWWRDYEASQREKGERGAYQKTLKLDAMVARQLVLASTPSPVPGRGGRTLRGVEAIARALFARPAPVEDVEAFPREPELEDLWREPPRAWKREHWESRVNAVYLAVVRLEEGRAFTLTGRYPEWQATGYVGKKRTTEEKKKAAEERRRHPSRIQRRRLVRTPAGLKSAVPEIRLHPSLRLLDLTSETVGDVCARHAKMRTEK